MLFISGRISLVKIAAKRSKKPNYCDLLRSSSAPENIRRSESSLHGRLWKQARKLSQPTRTFLLALIFLAVSIPMMSYGQTDADCYSEESLTYDLSQRDRDSEFDRSVKHGGTGTWGPRAAAYPSVVVPKGCDPVKWKRLRVVAVAERYVGLPYRHHHIPQWDPDEGPGLDCSNFTSWVYRLWPGNQIHFEHT